MIESTNNHATQPSKLSPSTTKRHEYVVRNIVIKVTLSKSIVIRDVVDILGFGSYDPSKFSAVICKFVNPKVTVNIFSSGKMIVTGAKCVYSAHYVLFKLKYMLNIEYTKIEVTNMLATLNLGRRLDIEKIYEANRDSCIYDIKLFPSLVFTQNNSSCGSSIFDAGSITIYGCKTPDEIDDTIDKVMKVINSVR